MTEPLYELTDLTEEQLAADPRIGMRRLAFEFFLQQEYFGTAAMMVAEITKGGLCLFVVLLVIHREAV